MANSIITISSQLSSSSLEKNIINAVENITINPILQEINQLQSEASAINQQTTNFISNIGVTGSSSLESSLSQIGNNIVGSLVSTLNNLVNSVIGAVESSIINTITSFLGGQLSFTTPKKPTVNTTPRVILTYAEQQTLTLDRQIISSTVNPTQVPLVISPLDTLFDNSGVNGSAVSISPTQPGTTYYDPHGHEPPMAPKGVYPYVQVHTTESGHIKEIDDTPGHERLLDMHRTGTYTEINADGRKVNKIVGDNFTIVVQDDKTWVSGYMDLYVQGNIRITCLNDVSLNVGGRVEINSGDDVRIKGKSISLESSQGDINIVSNGNTNLQTLAGYDFNLFSGANASFQTSGQGSFNLNSQGAIITSSVQGTTLNDLGPGLFIDALNFQVNDDVAQPAPLGIGAKKTGLGNAPTRGITTAPSIGEIIVQGIDDDSSTAVKAIDDALAAGRITQQQYDDLKKAPSGGTTDSSPSPKIQPSASNPYISTIPDHAIDKSLKMSKNYTLASLSTATTVSSYELVAQNGLSIAQIAQNLSLLAQNVIEPINSKWGPITINSGFRAGTGSSQHLKGMAVDITYGTRSTDPTTMMSIAQWIRDNVPFDQLILEYGTAQIWTHVSFNGQGTQRYQILTCPNPAANQYLPGLIEYDSWSPK